MTKWRVTPSPGSGDTNQPWRLKKNGRYVNKTGFSKQQNAINKAKRKGSRGDKLIIHGHDGRIRDRRTLRS